MCDSNVLFVSTYCILLLFFQSTYTSLDVERMKAEMEALRRQLAERPVYTPAPAPAPAPAPVVEAPKPKEMTVVPALQRELIVTRSNKWDGLVDVTEKPQSPKERGATKAVVFEVETPVKKEEEPAPAPVVVVAENPKPAPKPAKPVPVPVPVEEPPALHDVDLLFPAQYNHQLSLLLFSKQDFKVTVPSDIPIDDLLFEVRKAASTKVNSFIIGLQMFRELTYEPFLEI